MDISRNKDFEFAILVETERFLRARYGANRQWQATVSAIVRIRAKNLRIFFIFYLPFLS